MTNELKNKVTVFWHICELNNWKDVVQDQYLSLLESGLLDLSEFIYVTFLGSSVSKLNWLVRKSHKIRIKNYSNDLSHFERLCLNDLGEWSKKNNSFVFYFHSKGVSKIEHKENVWAWRKMLEHFLLFEHKKCISLLEEYDTVGGNLCDVGCNMHDGSPLLISGETHKMHYSGNFWWSKSKYLSLLPRIPESIPLDRDVNYWICERWILQPYPDFNHKVLFTTEKNHYYNERPENYLSQI